AGAVDVSGLVAAARSAELHKIMGTTEEWLEQRLGGAAELFVTNRTATFEGFEETPEEREMAAGRSPLAQPTGVQVRRRYRQMAVILRSNANRAFLLRAYGGRCQLSGAVLRLADGVSMDSAHIQPLGAPHEGPDDVGNMLSLSPTMHRLFDHGAIRVDPENLEIRLLHGNDLPHLPRLSLHPDHRIDVDRLRYHARRIVREHLT
ncbi:MAG TPA: HNH endonuclease, partial [Candidatus Binatia bacterium]|nr:HNH endonuclease [Candidatus Binatia bacterium]